MCNFKSALFLKNGDMVESEHTDSHESLILSAELRDNSEFFQYFVRVELNPPEDLNNISDIKKWRFKVDQLDTPDWWSKIKNNCEEKLRTKVSKMILVNEKKNILLGGTWILVNSNIQEVHNSRIISIHGTSVINTMRDSSKVDTMWDSSEVNAMWDSSEVNAMRDSSEVNAMRDSSKVNVMYNSSKVNAMRDSSKVDTMFDSSQIGTMRDSSQIDTMRDSSKVLKNN